MAINFKAMKAKLPGQAQVAAPAPETPKVLVPSKTVLVPGSKTGGASWYQRGKASQEAMAKDAQRAAARQQEMGKLWRFWLKEDEEARITFVDGVLDAEGLLDVITFREHNEKINGKWGNFFVCTADIEPCPICAESREGKLVGALTIIDHREFTGKKKTYKDRPKLYIAPRNVLKQLQSYAGKRGGLAGTTWDVMRTGDNSPGCGNSFDFIEKNDVQKLQQMYLDKDPKTGKPFTVFVPAKYDEEIVYRTAAELRELGFGKGQVIGGESAVAEGGSDIGKHL